ncbi:MAG TPA: DUF3618 domain-containing protein [Pyrinomonadaceae bacterium]|jgi:ElaB/YqjD/DUF883 family membrane-anchored ribosome-binding protein
MAEKSSELTKNVTEEGGGVLTDSDKSIISTVAGSGAGSTSDRDAFIEKYSDDYAAGDSEVSSITTNTSEEAPEETEHLRAQIEETRSQMGETIDAIQERLSFQNISDQVKESVSEHISSAIETAKDTVYDATIRKAGDFMQSMNKSVNKGLDEISKSEAVSIMRANPLALSLIGLGVGLLLMNGYKKKSYRYADDSSGGHQGKGAYASGGAAYSGGNRGNQPSMLKSAQDKITGTATSAYESVGNVAGSAYGSVSNVAGSTIETVSGAASNAYSSVTGAATNVYSSATDYAGKAYERVGDFGTQAREQYDHYIEENPLAVGAVALALGAAVGMALPSTRVEGQLMGEHKQQLLQKAQDTAGELVDRVKQVATEAQKTITEEVKTQAQGLTQ